VGSATVISDSAQVRPPAQRAGAFGGILAVLDGHKTSRAEKNIFRKKNGRMANMASQRAQKWAIFLLLVVPRFTPRRNNRKGVLNTGAYNFDDIWDFGGPDLVKNGQKLAI
jgi:hypothetical protein